MGQGASTEATPRSREEITHELAKKFAEKCFTNIEFYSLKEVFKSLADKQQEVRYLREDTVARFLEIPDVLGVSPVLFQMISYLAAFPFLEDAPKWLGLEQLVMVVAILTERYRRVLRGDLDRRKLLFRSLAVFDRKMVEIEKGPSPSDKRGVSQVDSSAEGTVKSHVAGFAVDAAGDEEVEDGNEDEDELVLAAFESLDYADALKQLGSAPASTQGAMIPTDNFRRLIMLLLLIAPLGAQDHLASYSGRISSDEQLDRLRSTAESILATFIDVEQSPGIKYRRFTNVIPISFPFLFSGFNALLDHFLFSKELDLNKRKDGNDRQPSASQLSAGEPILRDQGSILDLNVLSQLSFFLPGESLFRRLRLLYSGDEDGFSMGSFESKVFNWRAPTILVVRGTRLPDIPSSGQEVAFAATLAPRRRPHGGPKTYASEDGDTAFQRVTFGAFLATPWRHSHRDCFGDAEVLPLLFQLEPYHDVFHASHLNKDYASFIKPSSVTGTSQGGVAFGTPAPTKTALSLSSSPSLQRRQSSGAGLLSPGPVSLHLDASLEFGVFTHDYTARGGAYATSLVRKFDWQERFAIEAVEVWGLGGDVEAKGQADRWAWESREAEARRRINRGTGELDADRALLEMAGLVGSNRSGGSMV
jgi:hypothetical protein